MYLLTCLLIRGTNCDEVISQIDLVIVVIDVAKGTRYSNYGNRCIKGTRYSNSGTRYGNSGTRYSNSGTRYSNGGNRYSNGSNRYLKHFLSQLEVALYVEILQQDNDLLEVEQFISVTVC